MNCEKCGNPIPENIDYCSACSLAENPNYIKYLEEQKQKENNEINNNEQELKTQTTSETSIINAEKSPSTKTTAPTKNKSASIYIIIFLVSTFLWFFLDFLRIGFNWIFFIVALITIITGKINCPNSREIKLLFWILIGLFVLGAIAITLAFITCMSNCPG